MHAGVQALTRLGDMLEAIGPARRATLVAYGTSLTAERTPRFWRRCGGAWVGQLRALLDRRFAGRVVVRNAAGWGRDSSWGLRRLERRVLVHEPDIVLVEFSINDADRRRGISLAASRRNTAALLETLRARAPACRTILMTMSPALGRHAKLRPDLAAYYALYRDLAGEHGVGLADHFPAWQALDPRTLGTHLPDGLHPTPEAAAIILPGLGLATRAPAAGR